MNKTFNFLETSKTLYQLYLVFKRHLFSKSWQETFEEIQYKNYADLDSKKQKYVRDTYHNMYKNPSGKIYYWLGLFIETCEKKGAKSDILDKLKHFENLLKIEEVFLEKYITQKVISARESSEFVENCDEMRDIVKLIEKNLDEQISQAQKFANDNNLSPSRLIDITGKKRMIIIGGIALATIVFGLGVWSTVQWANEDIQFELSGQVHQFQEETSDYYKGI